MIEALYKKHVYIIYLIFFKFLFATNSINYKSQEFVISNYIPQNLTKYNIGVKVVSVKNKFRKYLTSQNWITNNLYIGGIIRADNNKDVNVVYGLNVGYKSDYKIFNSINLIYDFSYYSKRLTQNYRWKKVSIIVNVYNVALSYNYIFNNDEESKYINFDIFHDINKQYILNVGIKKYDLQLSPYLSIIKKI